jgi:hypothetical protein
MAHVAKCPCSLTIGRRSSFSSRTADARRRKEMGGRGYLRAVEGAGGGWVGTRRVEAVPGRLGDVPFVLRISSRRVSSLQQPMAKQRRLRRFWTERGGGLERGEDEEQHGARDREAGHWERAPFARHACGDYGNGGGFRRARPELHCSAFGIEEGGWLGWSGACGGAE